jgi:acetyl esterase/lipase
VHYGEVGKAKPVFLFIHGGGWISGDKAEVVNPKLSQVGSFAQDNGYILVAANYRLVDVNASQQGLPVFTYKDQASDVAHAVAWVKKNISKYGGNPNKIVLVGHSAGAHLVPLAILDSRYLAEVGYSSSAVSRAILLDVHAYDIPYAISLMTNNRSFSPQIPSLKKMFGQTATEQLEASPSNYIIKGKTMPSFLVISAGIMDGVVHDITKLTSEAFSTKLNSAGIKASHSYFQNETHSSLVSDLNTAGDKAAASVKAFLSDF